MHVSFDVSNSGTGSNSEVTLKLHSAISPAANHNTATSQDMREQTTDYSLIEKTQTNMDFPSQSCVCRLSNVSSCQPRTGPPPPEGRSGGLLDGYMFQVLQPPVDFAVQEVTMGSCELVG